MWSLYLLPGKIMAELGFLWPKPGQTWASRRRRESSFAHFILATPFWVVFALFVVPVVITMVSGSGHRQLPAIAPTTTTTSAAPNDDTSSKLREAGREEQDDAAQPPPRAAQASETERPKPPRVTFAQPAAVVQKLPQASSTAYPTCSATVTDHCVDR